MKAIVIFKVFSEGRVKYKRISMEHNLKEIPACTINGINFPPTSVEYQLMELLDKKEEWKKQLMIKYDWDFIIDYSIAKNTQKKSEQELFAEFCKPYLNLYPQLKIPFEVITKELKSELFGKRKSNETKFKEVCKAITIAEKAIASTLYKVEQLLSSENNLGFKSIK